MTVIIEDDQVVADLIRQAVPGPAAILPTTAQLAQHLDRDPSEHTVVLGPSVAAQSAVDVAEQNRIRRPALGVVVVRASVDNDVLAWAMRSGVREVVPTDDLADLGHAVRRTQSLARAMAGPRGRPVGDDVPGALLTIFSTKGGVGKSLVATNLAAALADLGHRVCIVDLDIEGGDVAIMMSLTPAHTLADLARIKGDLDESAVESLLTPHSDRLSVLASPVHLGATVSAESVGTVLEILKRMFDVVVVDTAGSFDDHALHALDKSDLLVLVGTLDIPSLKNLKLAVGTLDLLNVPRDLWRLCVNRADPKVGLTLDEVATTLGLAATATLPASRQVLTAVNRGEQIVRVDPGHEVSRKLAAFAATLARGAGLADKVAAGAGARRSGLRGLRTRKLV
ncbi:P-loop NTPase [Nocardioides sp. 31GB23]|uniref:AAA family ATPase n=1 Tax=Nocardioides sp. 31GB23 TaxID=3156065 RepID=UPI0032AF35C1